MHIVTHLVSCGWHIRFAHAAIFQPLLVMLIIIAGQSPESETSDAKILKTVLPKAEVQNPENQNPDFQNPEFQCHEFWNPKL